MRDKSSISQAGGGLVVGGEALHLEPWEPELPLPEQRQCSQARGHARRDRAPRSWQRRGSAEARQALSAERDAYKPRAAILSLLSGLPFASPGAQCAVVAALSPLALPLFDRPPGKQARKVLLGKH